MKAALSTAGRRRTKARAGYTLTDALVAIAVVMVVGLFAIMALSRGRESARWTNCQRNLAQIGVALAYYDGSQGSLPGVGEPSPVDSPAKLDAKSPGPLKALLETLGVSSFVGIDPEARNLNQLKGPMLTAVAVPGFFCQSDPHATGGLFPSPISYRATTGDDPAGRGGGFAIGERTSLAAIEAADGVSYTAAFSERLVGNGQPRPARENYAVVEGPVAEPGGDESSGDWRGDAGSSWEAAGWPSTLYNHALLPGATTSRLARDGRSALMGASSGHVPGVGLLMFDGGVKRISRKIDPAVWRAYGTLGATGKAPEHPADPKPSTSP